MNSPVPPRAEDTSILRRRNDGLTATVVVCTRNRPAALRNCIASIARLDPAPDAVLVVDNSEGNRETESVACEFGARYMVEPKLGLSRARNRGLAECDTDIVVYLDDDAIPASDWLGLLLAPFADEKTGASSGRVITPESSSKDQHHEIPRCLSNLEPRWFEIATFGGMGLGSNMALRKRACTSPKFFDERLAGELRFKLARRTTPSPVFSRVDTESSTSRLR